MELEGVLVSEEGQLDTVCILLETHSGVERGVQERRDLLDPVHSALRHEEHLVVLVVYGHPYLFAPRQSVQTHFVLVDHPLLIDPYGEATPFGVSRLFVLGEVLLRQS